MFFKEFQPENEGINQEKFDRTTYERVDSREVLLDGIQVSGVG